MTFLEEIKNIPFYVYPFLVLLIGFAIYHYLPKVKHLFKVLKGNFQQNKQANLFPAEKWAIAAGAILAERNSQYVNSMETGIDKRTIKEGLRKWWSIYDQNTAIENSTWLMEVGHREKFEIVKEIITNVPQSDWKKIAREIDPSGDLYGSVTNLMDGLVALKKDKMLTEGDFNKLSILSWDLSRLINNCRWCLQCDYLDEDEAWSYIMEASKKIQEEYNSWEELAKGYLIGRAMWNGTESDFDLVVSIVKSLLEKEKSPWKQIPWDTQLS